MSDSSAPSLWAWLKHVANSGFGRFLGIVLPAFSVFAALAVSKDFLDAIGLAASRRDSAQTWAVVSLVILVVAQIVLQVLTAEVKREVVRLLAERDAARGERDVAVRKVQTIGENMKSFLDGLLLDLAVNRLKFPREDGECGDRISLYAHDNAGCFVPLARFSFNPKFRDVGRAKYPADQGFIGCAWGGGRCFQFGLPDPAADKAGYLQRHSAFDVPKKIVDGLRMKSRLYYAVRLDAEDSSPMAVIVLESCKPDRWSEAELKDIFEDEDKTRLAELVAIVFPFFGSEGNLAQKGL